MNGGPAVFDVEVSNNVIVARLLKCNQAKNVGDVMMSVLAQKEVEVVQDVQQGLLLHFHRRLGHLNYDTIIRMAKEPGSGIA